MIFTHHGINSIRRAIVPATGALTLEMNVTGQGFDPTRTFHVIVIFGYPVDYTVDGTPIANPDAYYNGYLKDGDSVTLGNLPAGVSLTIVEDITSADTAAGYAQVSITGNPGNVIAGTTSTVSFTNSYTAPGDALTPYEDRGIGLSASGDNSGRLSVPDSKNQSLFVVVPGVSGKVITAFDVWTDQPDAASVYKTNEVVATTFRTFDFLGHDPSVTPQQVLAQPPSYATSWTTTQESDGSYRQHIVLDTPITMESGRQYGFIVTTRGDVNHTNCVCSSLASAQNLMLTSTEWYEPSPQYDPPAVVFSWWEANKYCFAGAHAPSIKFYST